jgi:predicted permease
MSWLRRLTNTFRTGRLRGDIDRELEFHVAERADQLCAEGLSHDEARRRARLQFGSPAAQIERTRDVDVSGALDGLLRNIRHAWRGLIRTPGFTLTAVLTLALGIGANGAVFSAIDAVLLQPLPYRDADRLVRLRQTMPAFGETDVAGARILDWRRLGSSFEALSGWVMEDLSDTTAGLPERVRRVTVLPGFLEAWGIAPALGRGFTDAEHTLGGPPAVLISDRYWRGRFGADPQVLAKSVRFGDRSYAVVGVMPASFAFLERDADWWTPEWTDAPWSQSRQFRSTTGIGRLKPGVTIEQARADLARAQTQLAALFPATDRDVQPVVLPLKEDIVGASRGSLWLLFGAVSVLLLIACSNIAALLLSRGAARAQEIAVRSALGATRSTVARQLLTEAGVLAVAGGAAGLLVAVGAAAALRRLAPDLPRLQDAGVDVRILVYTMACVVVVTLLCGLLPALRSSRGALQRAAGQRVSARHSLQWLLAGTQVALAVTLLSGAGLLLRSVMALSQVDAGFDSTHVLTFRISGSFGEEQDYNRTVQRINRTLDELRAMPGVTAAATTTQLPGTPGGVSAEFELVEGRAGERFPAEVRVVSPSYFETMRIPIAAGELCRRPVDATGTTEVMVNRRFAERYLAGRQAVGMHLAAVSPDRIIGVVGDAREQGIDRSPAPAVYMCFSAPTPFPLFLVRTSGDPAALSSAVRLKINELEPLRSVYDVAPLEERIGDAYAENRLRTVVLGALAVTALVLACLGIYGTLGYLVSLRRREIGLRLALGAARSRILRQFVGQGVRVAAVACAFGLALSFVFTRALSGMLFGVTPNDPATLAAAVGGVLSVAALAALIPAARAALVQPMRTLRDE